MVKLLYEEPDLEAASELVPGPLLAVVAKAIADGQPLPERRGDGCGDPRGAGAPSPRPSRFGPCCAADHPTVRRHPAPGRHPAPRSDAAGPGAAGVDRAALAEYIGPIAGRLLRRALESAATPEALCEKLAESIDAPPEMK